MLYLPPPSRTPNRYSAVDALRTLAIVLVMVAHYIPDNFWGQNGIEGVYIFFVCSGFLIARTTANRESLYSLNVGAFYRRRFARLVPLLLLTIALATLANYVLPLDRYLSATLYVDNPQWLIPFIPFAWVWRHWAQPAFGIKGLFWGLLWTLGCEFHFYLVFPWLMRWAGNQKRASWALLAIIVVGVMSSLWAVTRSAESIEWLHTNPFNAYALIAMGVLLHFALCDEGGHRWAPYCLGVGSLCLMVSIAWLNYALRWQAEIAPWLVGVSTIALLYGLLARKVRFPKWLCLPGTLCYGLYLWHPFAQYLLWSRFGLIGYLLGSFAIACTSYGVFEKQLQNRLR